MQAFNEIQCSQAGIYRMSMEDMLYNKPRKVEKKVFSDAALMRAKKVSKLVEKFESGVLDKTLDTPEKKEKDEVIVPSVVVESPRSVLARRLQTVELSPVLGEQRPPVPKQRTFSLKSSREARSKTPESRVCNENFVPELVETPILRTLAKPFSGSNIFASERIASRNKYFGKKTDSIVTPSSSATPSTDNGSRKNSPDYCHEFTGSSSTSSNEEKSNLQYQQAREEMHQKLKECSEWQPDTLRTVAVAVAKMRNDVLSGIPQNEYTTVLLKLYQTCINSKNLHIETICCSLISLMDNVRKKEMSSHEKYIAEKYFKRKTRLDLWDRC
ncbi:unnamed protein product [Caenorhabditis sp. 36 PRJEB53466]|nr:unnamed protein product [Caenorhabditis sp. 36 PRJEB53466]